MAKQQKNINERVSKIERALWGENGYKGLLQRQAEDDERFEKLYNKYYGAYMYLKTIVNIGKWATRILMGLVSLLGILKYKEIWEWFTENLF